MNPTPALSIQPLTPARLPDFLAFFDTDAFADNPGWAFCYCQFLHMDHTRVVWKERSAADNRAAACERIGAGGMEGYLAYADGRVVGWCNAAPRTKLASLDDEPDPLADTIGVIGCFVVAKPYRRQGISRALLQAACDGLQAQGMLIADAYPRRDAQSDAELHCGALEMFMAAGFVVRHEDDDGNVHVRKQL